MNGDEFDTVHEKTLLRHKIKSWCRQQNLTGMCIPAKSMHTKLSCLTLVTIINHIVKIVSNSQEGQGEERDPGRPLGPLLHTEQEDGVL